MELLELRRRRSRWSVGLRGLRPDWRAKRFRMSVREMTPMRRPEMRAPGRAAVEMEGAGKLLMLGDGGGWGEVTASLTEGAARGVAGVDGEGEADSTTHIR
jgi:hypothetical protein